ncbi:hypothetical protein ABES02_29655 [Neobacillus pocheonensis]|uniref:hypothetical protein n=1 Tax=Neobacillus pocheonensis TaxID=363869 RepID=UPI003D2DD6DE
MIRTYQDLDYFEKHIVEILKEDYGRDQQSAVDIVNEYMDILQLLNDGHESANSFAEMFDDAYRSGTSGQAWMDNISNYLLENVTEIKSFLEFLETQNTPMTIRPDGVFVIKGKPYVAMYVGESHPTHTVRWGTFYVSLDLTDIQTMDYVTGDVISLEEWRRLEKERRNRADYN